MLSRRGQFESSIPACKLFYRPRLKRWLMRCMVNLTGMNGQRHGACQVLQPRIPELAIHPCAGSPWSRPMAMKGLNLNCKQPTSHQPRRIKRINMMWHHQLFVTAPGQSSTRPRHSGKRGCLTTLGVRHAEDVGLDPFGAPCPKTEIHPKRN